MTQDTETLTVGKLAALVLTLVAVLFLAGATAKFVVWLVLTGWSLSMGPLDEVPTW